MTNDLTAEECKAVVLEIAQLTRAKYVHPELGEELAHRLESKLEQGAYEDAAHAHELAMKLSMDLRQWSNDGHWAVMYDPDRAVALVDPETEQDEAQLLRWQDQARRNNYGFAKVEHLQGNIGYIDLRQFVPSEYAGDTAVAAMALVAHCDALIFDLRQNHGGYPSMVQLITSYLFKPGSQHLNSFYYRPTDEYQQFWTFPHVPGRRMPEVPVYVLTSNATGSGAEEFAYNLKSMERATLVGETTAGAAHPVSVQVVQSHFLVRLPYGRPINPITQDNWEGTGVEPHIAVAQERALETAHLHALERLLEQCTDDQQRQALAWGMDIVQSSYAPVTLDEVTLSRYAGRYGDREFVAKEGTLFYRPPVPSVSWALIPLSEKRFRLDEDVKFEFVLGEHNLASTVVIAYRDGRPTLTAARSV